MQRKISFLILGILIILTLSSCAEIYDWLFGNSNQSQSINQYYFANKDDGSLDWEDFYSHIRHNAPDYTYIFVRSESTDIYHEYALNLTVNQYAMIYYYYEDGKNYQLILRNNDPGYFGTVRRFNNNQTEAAFEYFNDQLPNIFKDILPWLFLF